MNKKFLVIQTAFPGDAILTLPFIQKLNESNPFSIIDVVCIPATAEIFSASPFVNKVIILNKRKEHKSLLSIIKFSLKIKNENYSKVYSPHRSFRSSLIVFLSSIKESYGYDVASMSFIYKNKIKYEKSFHEVQRILQFLGDKKQIKNWNILPEINVSEESVKKIDDYLKQFRNNKIAAVAPGSVWNTKIYPEKYYCELIKFLRSKDFEVVLLGGKSDRAICGNILNNFEQGVISAAGEFSIVESIEILKNCELLICNDSAPTHMAMCADIPVVTIYCSTVPAFGFFPYNKKSITVSYDDLDCKPCGIHGHNKCPINTFDCGNKLLPEKIIDKIEEIISSK